VDDGVLGVGGADPGAGLGDEGVQGLAPDIAGVVLLGPEDLPQAHRGGRPGDGEEGHQLTGLGRGRIRQGDLRAVALDPVATEDVDPHGGIELGGGRREFLSLVGRPGLQGEGLGLQLVNEGGGGQEVRDKVAEGAEARGMGLEAAVREAQRPGSGEIAEDQGPNAEVGQGGELPRTRIGGRGVEHQHPRGIQTRPRCAELGEVVAGLVRDDAPRIRSGLRASRVIACFTANSAVQRAKMLGRVARGPRRPAAQSCSL